MWPVLFYVNSLYFQQWNSNRDIAFLNSFLDLKLQFLNAGPRLCIDIFFKSQKDWKLEFLHVILVGLLNCFQFMKGMENWYFSISPFIFCQIVSRAFQACYVCRRGGAMIKLPAFKNRNIHIYATNLCQFKCWWYCFQAWMRLKIAKLHLVFWCKF